MYRGYSFYRLDFHDDQLLHEQIHTISEFELDPVINNRQTNLGRADRTPASYN